MKMALAVKLPDVFIATPPDSNGQAPVAVHLNSLRCQYLNMSRRSGTPMELSSSISIMLSALLA
jgi:hypothetical protein